MSQGAVAITGIGVVSALGRTADAHVARWLAGASGVTPMVAEDYRSFPRFHESVVGAIDRRSVIDNRMLRKILSESACFALMAARDALGGARLIGDRARLARAGLYVGSICMELDLNALVSAVQHSLDASGRFDLARFGQHGMNMVDPLFLVKSLPNGGIGGIAIEHQILGPNTNITNGPTSALQALGMAAGAVARGEIEIAMVGGYDSLRSLDARIEHVIAGRLADGERSEEACRPFDRGRRGHAIGEGAAFAVLETVASARARGVEILAELTGWCDRTAARLRAPEGRPTPIEEDALRCAAAGSLRMAECDPSAVDVVLGDALAVPDDDDREIAVMRSLFGAGRRVGYASATPAIGFMGAAAGAFSLVHAVAALSRQVLPPTLNCTDPVEGAPAIVPVARPQTFRHALAWCSDRGRKASAVLLRRAPEGEGAA